MVFKRCTIDGIDYDHERISVKSEGPKAVTIPKNVNLEQTWREARKGDKEKVIFVKSLLVGKALSHSHRSCFQYELIQDFFLLLCVCNTVIVAKHPHHDNMNASGIICATPGTASATSTARLARKIRRKKQEAKVTIAPLHLEGDFRNDR